MRRTRPPRRTGSPFLHRVDSLPEKFDRTRFPFNLQAFSGDIGLEFRTAVTFFVGENGSGKSTLLEALAECCGFNPEGGNRDHHRAAFGDRSELAQALRLSWMPKVTEASLRANRGVAGTWAPSIECRNYCDLRPLSGVNSVWTGNETCANSGRIASRAFPT